MKEPAAPAHVKIENVLRFQHGYVYEFNGDRYVRVGKAEDLDCRILECNPPIYCFKQNGNPCDDYIVGLTVQFNGKNISGSADSDKRTFYLVKAKKARQGKGKKS